MRNDALKFDLQQDYSTKALATYLAQLVREGVTYTINQNGPEVTVKLTGGF